MEWGPRSSGIGFFCFHAFTHVSLGSWHQAKLAPSETENNAYTKFWDDKRRALWYVMVFSGVVNKPLYRYGGHIELI